MRAIVERFGDPGSRHVAVRQRFGFLHEQFAAGVFSGGGIGPQQRVSVGSDHGGRDHQLGWHRDPTAFHCHRRRIGQDGDQLRASDWSRATFLKRLCTVGWVLTALFALALFADSPELAADPDKTWGVASRELLGPGLTGLMLACLLAALMSSVDAYMIVGSALVVRNIYAPFWNPAATEKEYVKVARITGAVIVGGAVVVSLLIMDVFEQLQLTWIIPVLFAAPFWVGMYWRRATTAAAWGTVAFSAMVFFVIPDVAPRIWPAMREMPLLLDTNQIVRIETTRAAAHSDVARRQAEIILWEARRDQREARVSELCRINDGDAGMAVAGMCWRPRRQRLRQARDQQPARPVAAAVGRDDDRSQDLGRASHLLARRRGGRRCKWTADRWRSTRARRTGRIALRAVDPTCVGLSGRRAAPWSGSVTSRLPALQAVGDQSDDGRSDARLNSLELLPKIVTPFLVMIGLSWLTRPIPRRHWTATTSR